MTCHVHVTNTRQSLQIGIFGNVEATVGMVGMVGKLDIVGVVGVKE